MEIWQVAAVFGLAEPSDADAEDAPPEVRPTASASDRSGRAMLKARVKAAQEGRRAPTWGPPSKPEQAALAPLLTYGGAPTLIPRR